MINLCILYGGTSSEYDISCISATTIFNALQKEDIEITLIGISRSGEWFYQPDIHYQNNILTITCEDKYRVRIQPVAGLQVGANILDIDVVFPALHGTFGEDGGVQAILELCKLSYIGSNQTASAIGMNKLLSKMYWHNHNLPIVEYCSCTIGEYNTQHNAIPAEITAFIKQYNYPIFIKPCNGGSSIGVHKVNNASQLQGALQDASQFDAHILCERAIIGREIEFAVLNTPEGDILVSNAGEISTHQEFYDYDTKYTHTDRAKLIIPAHIDDATKLHMTESVQEAYRLIGCRDLARVDILLEDGGAYYLNEINTLPGFTAQSMFPMLWHAAGYPLHALLMLLINGAIHRTQP